MQSFVSVLLSVMRVVGAFLFMLTLKNTAYSNETDSYSTMNRNGKAVYEICKRKIKACFMWFYFFSSNQYWLPCIVQRAQLWRWEQMFLPSPSCICFVCNEEWCVREREREEREKGGKLGGSGGWWGWVGEGGGSWCKYVLCLSLSGQHFAVFLDKWPSCRLTITRDVRRYSTWLYCWFPEW